MTGIVMRVSEKGQIKVNLVLVDEDGGLKVDQLVLGDDKAP